jgi:prepilin-type N-terminal cleavage/methylation domain-containing protein
MSTAGRLLRGQGGFTLVESLLATAIGALVMGAVVMTLYQFNTLPRLHQDSLTVNHQLQSVGTVLNRDVVSAAGGVVVGAAGATTQTLTLQIPSYAFGELTDPVTHTVVYTYSAADGTLVRQDDAGAVTVGRQISAVDFGPEGEIAATYALTITSTIRDQTRVMPLTLHRRLGAE